MHLLLLLACAGSKPDPTDSTLDSATDSSDTGTPPAPERCGYTPAVDLDPASDVVEVNLTASMLEWDPGTGVPLMEGLAFEGSVPGPVIEATRGDTVRIHLVNDTDMPLTMHWHGLRVPDSMDGILQMDDPIQPGSTFTYEYTLKDAGFYWYHPHMDTDSLLERGLYGVIIAREQGENPPSCELPIVLDDILLDDALQIAPKDTTMMQLMGRLGTLLLANGRADRQVEVAAGQAMLLRLVNASNARFFDIYLEGHQLKVVGTDGGWLAESYTVDHLEIAPGERYIVQVENIGTPGSTYRLMNKRFQLHAQDADMVEEDPLGNDDHPVMSFVYAADPVTPEVWTPPTPDAPSWTGATETLGHHWVLDEDMMGGKVYIDGLSWPDVPLVTVAANLPTTFEIENKSEMHHPFHIHGNRYQLVAVDGQPVSTPAGWKDTWDVPPDSTLTLVSELDNPGTWMYHCHILEHAEMGMAGLMEVTP